MKARAKALGVELKRVSSTLTTWPGEFLDLGEQLHQHLQEGNPMGTFPGLPPAISDGTEGAVPASKALAKAAPAELVALVTAIRETALPAADPLAVPRALAAAADEALPLSTTELAELLQMPEQEMEALSSGATIRGFRLRRRGRGRGQAWLVERCWRDGTAT